VVRREEYDRYFFEVTATMRDGRTANLREASQNDPIADVCCDQDGGLLCGLCGLVHVRLLLTQHFLATAAYFMPGCSPSRGSGHSMIPTSVDSRPTLRCILYELTEGGRSGLVRESALRQKVQERSNYGLLVIEKTVVVRSRKHQVGQVSLAPDRSQFFR